MSNVSHRVLVVDDEPSDREIIAMLLMPRRISTFNMRRLTPLLLVISSLVSLSAPATAQSRRYDAKDTLRMGNHNLLGSVSGDIALEFLYGRPHSLLSPMHLDNRNRLPNPGLRQ